MITINVRCSREDCDHAVVLTVLAKHFYAGQRFKDYLPRGWRVRTPKAEGSAAFAYCPQHAAGSLAP